MNHHFRLTMNFKFWVLRFQNAAQDVGDVQVRMMECKFEHPIIIPDRRHLTYTKRDHSYLRVNCKSL